jgi:hypothetical protein
MLQQERIERAKETERIVKEIIEQERLERVEKTERLRAARMQAHEDNTH